MQDLIRQLRAFAQGCRGSMWQSRDETIRLMDEAAEALTTAQAEIERLTKALEATRDHCPQCEGEGQYLFGLRRNQNMVPCEFCENARAALSERQQ